ncbi:triokinase/FMN cyclase-like [Vanessa atalanta]|uniref:triokinase/FMN cyclase-like n=1 Tax=Vanessa atalanta TaxID=42275 RepID=UPI001FCCC470|nr:triokinase/FMN cyclase-like [Vanessa atalanta]XP_047530058.1 triokinase/FMN cyclase-like [Vanessa atalanta]XP_047530059.1 triokinase/FMN cyclase-like [Vanessa atalanta]
MASSKPITKKVINSPESCVDDNLRGVVALYPKLLLHPKHRVVTLRRKDDSGRVAVLGGGGSGHEPFAAGLIGPGMLDGAVAGGVFASPPTGNVLYAITQLYKYNSGGVLVLLGNYTGDRLNFGKAFEKAKNAGIKVEGFIVGEDVASSQNKTGGRSMCGEVFLYKLCGAMAAEGHDLLSIRNMASEVNKNMATLGVCLSACSLPGQPPLFDIAQDEMELGAGVHGEAGIEKLKMGSAKETVVLILDKIVAHLKLQPKNRVAAMINNLGGTSLLEMNIIAAEIKDYLDRKQIKMERLYSGHFKTSLEMHGFQICLLDLSEERGDSWLRLLDAPSGAGAWSGCDLSVGGPGGLAEDDDLPQAGEGKITSGPTLSVQEQEILRESLRAASAVLVENEELLNRLDSGCGDGDCGITLKKFANAVLKYLETASLEYPSNVLWELSEMAETDMGGTSGGIYSLGLSAASQALSKSKSNDRSAWLSAMCSSATAISKYGGAEPGDCTMLDTLHSAAMAFKENLGADLQTLLLKINEAAERGAKATADMIPRAGRASYVSLAHSRGEDAGARALALLLRAALPAAALSS